MKQICVLFLTACYINKRCEYRILNNVRFLFSGSVGCTLKWLRPVNFISFETNVNFFCRKLDSYLNIIFSIILTTVQLVDE